MPIHRLSDSRLIRRSQQGDRDAFVALVQRYDERLRGLVYGLVAGREAMDRVMRIAYLKAWRDVVRADPDDDAGTWLYRTAYNACIDELRRESRRIEAPSASASSGPDDDPVVAALASLSPEERVVAVLVDREGFTPEGAARILGLSPDTLAARLAAARVHLRAAARSRRPRSGAPSRSPAPPRPAGQPRQTTTPRSARRQGDGTARESAGRQREAAALESAGRQGEGAAPESARQPRPDGQPRPSEPRSADSAGPSRSESRSADSAGGPGSESRSAGGPGSESRSADPAGQAPSDRSVRPAPAGGSNGSAGRPASSGKDESSPTDVSPETPHGDGSAAAGPSVPGQEDVSAGETEQAAADTPGDQPAAGADSAGPMAATPPTPAAGATNPSPEQEMPRTPAPDRPATLPDVPAAAPPATGPAPSPSPDPTPSPPGSLPR